MRDGYSIGGLVLKIICCILAVICCVLYAISDQVGFSIIWGITAGIWALNFIIDIKRNF